MQAFGAGQYETMTIIFQRTVLFLSAHMAPITAVVLSIPALCRFMGQPEDVVKLMMPYVLVSLPGVWLDAVDRPMNRMLIAQQISLPQMYISGAGTLWTKCSIPAHSAWCG
jgi:multidrug resistance protein, MATE family